MNVYSGTISGTISGDNFRINFGDNFREFFFSISAMFPITMITRAYSISDMKTSVKKKRNQDKRKTKTVQPEMKISVKKKETNRNKPCI